MLSDLLDEAMAISDRPLTPEYIQASKHADKLGRKASSAIKKAIKGEVDLEDAAKAYDAAADHHDKNALNPAIAAHYRTQAHMLRNPKHLPNGMKMVFGRVVKVGVAPKKKTHESLADDLDDALIEAPNAPTRAQMEKKVFAAFNKIGDAMKRGGKLTIRVPAEKKDFVLGDTSDEELSRLYARYVLRKTEETASAVKLPYNPWAYFLKVPDVILVPIKALRTIRARADGIKHAIDYMKAALDGGRKRKPISVEKNDDGSYTVVDGNSTVNVAKSAGWDKIPAIETDDTAHEDIDRDEMAFEEETRS